MSKEPGLNLADIAPMSEDIPLGKSYLTVYGVSAREALEIFKRYPKLMNILTPGGFDLKSVLTVAPDAVAAIIATAAGAPGNEAAEAKADKLPIEVQVDILEAVGRLTFTRGFAPFADKVMAMLGVDLKSGSSTRAKAMTSPPASKASSQPGTPQT